MNNSLIATVINKNAKLYIKYSCYDNIIIDLNHRTSIYLTITGSIME